jgi:hypothetical protein
MPMRGRWPVNSPAANTKPGDDSALLLKACAFALDRRCDTRMLRSFASLQR